MMTDEEFSEIEARHKAATPGPWRWFGHLPGKMLYLATVNRGRIYVMDFVRWGMRSAAPRFNVPSETPELTTMHRADELAETGSYDGYRIGIPHPDAIALERSWEDVDTLLAHVHEAEAQAARDAEVTAAADEYLDARIAIQQAEGVSWPEKAAALRAAEIALMSAAGKRRAALAAREEAE